MLILATRKGFEAFKCKVEPFNKAFEWKFELLERDWKYSNPNSNDYKAIRTIWLQIATIRKGFEAFERYF